MTFGDTPFHRHLLALSAEYERVVIENGELRREANDDGLVKLRRQESPPPLQPVTAYAFAEPLELPGMISDSGLASRGFLQARHFEVRSFQACWME